MNISKEQKARKQESLFSLSTFCFLLFAFLLSTSIVSAQDIGTAIQGINLKLSNDSPAPGQSITVTAESYVTTLSSANITWSLNGSVYQKGTGLTSINIKAPDLGKKLTVSINAVTSSGQQISNSIDIGSGDIDLIVETGGYTPPFFPGKTPLSYQNNYKIVAVPHLADRNGKEYAPATLVYTWEKNARIVQEASGYGKQVFSFKDEVVPRARLIRVTVATRDGSASAEKTIIIEANNPSIYFYVNDPLYGPLYNKAITNTVSLGKSRELAVLAVPYGFNKPADSIGSLSFLWSVNSVLQKALSSSQSIILRAPEQGGGSSNINLEIKNDNDFLQSARGSFLANFSNNQSSLQSSDNINFNGI